MPLMIKSASPNPVKNREVVPLTAKRLNDHSASRKIHVLAIYFNYPTRSGADESLVDDAVGRDFYPGIRTQP